MKTVTSFPREIVEYPDIGIVMPDGCRLSARVWMTVDAAENPVPAILEHLPYRKRDGTIGRCVEGMGLRLLGWGRAGRGFRRHSGAAPPGHSVSRRRTRGVAG